MRQSWLPPSAIGATALAVARRITAWSPSACARYRAHARPSGVQARPGLGEEPLPGVRRDPADRGGAVIGVLVLQRQSGSFSADEVTWHRARRPRSRSRSERRRAAAFRSARLHGPRSCRCTVLGQPRRSQTTTALANAAVDIDRGWAGCAMTWSRDAPARLGRIPAVAPRTHPLRAGRCAISGCASGSPPPPTIRRLRSVPRTMRRPGTALGAASEAADHAGEHPGRSSSCAC